jgi:hypothetical protein
MQTVFKNRNVLSDWSAALAADTMVNNVFNFLSSVKCETLDETHSVFILLLFVNAKLNGKVWFMANFYGSKSKIFFLLTMARLENTA